MAASQIISEDVDSWETLMFLYNSALKEVGTKLDILNDEFVHIHKYNPIEYIKKRIKTPESIVKKLKRDGYDVTVENMVNYINDIAGIRIVCSFTSDIYRLAEMIGKQNDLTVVSIKDYIKNPKASGYKSFHMHVTIPIFLSDRVVDTKVENAKFNEVPAVFERSDLFEDVTGTYDVIVSNPPYIRTEEIGRLEDEVKLHDPWIALDGKEDGLYFYRRIVKDSTKYIKKGGYLLFEIGFDQGKDVAKLMEDQGYEEIQVKKDLAGLDRVVMGRYNKE